MSKRDEFPLKVKQWVAMRAGWQCSICKSLTVGPSEESSTSIMKIGEAAHIAGASAGAGSRRYDETMTKEERISIQNAIWLCSHHAKVIDRDEITFTVKKLHKIKQEHELEIGRLVTTKASVDLPTGLLAIGPNVICTGDIVGVSEKTWTLKLAHFVEGDLHTLTTFISDFDKVCPPNRYILSNELGDGRMLAASPILHKEGSHYKLECLVSPSVPRVEVGKIGKSMAVGEDGDWQMVNGSFAWISGADYFPQMLKSVLSLTEGESFYSPNFGVRFYRYFEMFKGSPWLELLLKLDVVRMAATFSYANEKEQVETPLKCVNRVVDFNLLSEVLDNNRLPIKVSLDVVGHGIWEQELKVYVPTLQQMRDRAEMLAQKRAFRLGGVRSVNE